MNKELTKIMCSENEIINKLKESGFDILNDYMLLNDSIEKYDNGLINVIGFEIKDNELDTDWEDNGTIFLVFEYNKDTISCQIQLEAITDVINYSNYGVYINYNNLEFNPTKFKKEEGGFGEYGSKIRCNFSCFLNANKYKTIRIFNSITKSKIKLDKILKECVEEQDKIYEFDSKYYDYKMDIESESSYGKLYEDLIEEEKEELQCELDGIATYNQMVADGWIEED